MLRKRNPIAVVAVVKCDLTMDTQCTMQDEESLNDGVMREQGDFGIMGLRVRVKDLTEPSIQ